MQMRNDVGTGWRSRLNKRRLLLSEESGSALVELAFLMPMLLLVLVGAAEFGRLAYLETQLTDAAYAGVAYASGSHGTASSLGNISAVAASAHASLAQLTTASSLSCTCSDGTSTTCATAALLCVSPARIIEFVQVNTSATVTPIFNYPGVSSNWVLHGQATMRVVE